MSELHFFILSDSAVLDPATGKMTIVGTFRRILTRSFPCVHQACALSFELVADQGKHSCAVRLIDTNEQDVIPRMEVGEFMSDGFNPVCRVINFIGLPFPKSGIFTFILEVDEKRVGDIDCVVGSVDQTGRMR